jgi:hypothetical protein
MSHDLIPIDSGGKARYQSALGGASTKQEVCRPLSNKGKHVLHLPKARQNEVSWAIRSPSSDGSAQIPKLAVKFFDKFVN